MANVAHASPRPPTPPKENAPDPASIHTLQSYQETPSQHVLVHTPNESPTSSSDYIAGSARKSLKRVSFKDSKDVLDVKPRPSPLATKSEATIKSCLKQTPRVHQIKSVVLDPKVDATIDPKKGFIVILEEVTRQLNKASRDVRLDTYKAVQGYLGAHDNLPRKDILRDPLRGFLDCLGRDIVAKQPTTAKFDIELVTNVQKILNMVVCTQDLVDTMSEDFCDFVAEEALSSLEHQETPKVMVDHYMRLLARQKFPERTFSPSRINRILNSLNGLEERLKGNRVVGFKVMIYQRLLIQARSLMIGRAGQWLEFLVACLSSSIKEIRAHAIAFGTEAALALGETVTVSQGCLELLNREHPSGEKVVDSLGSRLLELLKDTDGATHVPQIWSIIVLFLRGRPHQIERWEHLTDWLGIMQQSFNSSDAKVKRQANIAWNRLVAAISLDTSTELSMLKMLRQPIATQLERKSNDKHLKTAKQVARSSYCNLLYYAFRPQPPQESLDLYWKRLDLYWENFVTPMLSPRASLTKSDHEFACQVLAAVFSSQEPRAWDPSRAHQTSLLIKPEELPCLDPRWVRLRATRIIGMIEKFLLHTDCPSLEDFQKSRLFIAWQSFTKALGEACSKDVHKVYMETMAAFAQITSMLNRYWHQKGSTTEAFLARLEVCSALINETVATVGFRPFIEKRLLRDTSGVAFEAAETPSSRSSVSHRYLNTPVMYILEFLVNNSHGTETSASYERAIQALLTIALHAASGRQRRLTTVGHLATDVLQRPYVTIPSRLVYWVCLVNETEAALSLPRTKTPASDSPQHPGQDYRQCILLLELGLQETNSDIYPAWKSLGDAVVKDIENEVGQAGIVLAYTEPLARVLNQGTRSSSGAFLRYGSYLVDQARWPVSRKELERARKQLWGPEQSTSKEASLDPFDHLYALMKRLWETVLDALRSIAKPDSDFLSMLQDLFTAGFGSRHRSTVNSMITMWDHVFARATNLQYPTELQAVLSKLRPTVDFELPGFVADAAEWPSSPLVFVDSEEDDIEAKPESAAAKASRLLMPRALPIAARHQSTASHSPGTPSARAPRRERRMTPKARFRHNDSQVQFAAIESSPLNPESSEAQHLTEHQKEIRERQENNAPMFKDIRSSSRTPQSAERPLKLVLHKRITSTKPIGVDDEPSPTFPPGDAITNDFSGSSPTPLSNPRSPVDHTSLDSPRFSPPKSTRSKSPGSLTDSMITPEPGSTPKATRVASDSAGRFPNASPIKSIAPFNRLNAPEIEAGSLECLPAHQIVSEQEHPEQVAPEITDSPAFEGHEISEAPEDPNMAMVVDAPTNEVDSNLTSAIPEPKTPRSMLHTQAKAAEKGHASISEARTIDKSLCQADPCTPTEDELVREQLFRDLDEASSQADSRVPKRRPSLSSPSVASKKRKNLSQDSAKPKKKARPDFPSSSQTVEVVVETRRDDLNSDDYVVIDDQLPDDTERPSSPSVKQEISPSPAKSLRPSSSQNSLAKMALGRRQTRSMAGGNSPGLSDAVKGSSQVETNCDSAEVGHVREHARKRRRSPPNPSQESAEPSKRRKQGNRPHSTPDAAHVQDGEREEQDIKSSQMEGIKRALLSNGDARLEAPEPSSNASVIHSIGGDVLPDASLDDAREAPEPSSTPTAGRSSGGRLLDRFKTLLNDLRNVTLWPAEEKAIMKVALEVVGGVHEAGFRNGRREQ
ncbi:MAG: hypothetical protein Q9169_006377 [Polycauliona sp. 2 TL-2023]